MKRRWIVLLLLFYDDRAAGVWIYQRRSTEGTKDKSVEDTGCLSGM